MFVHEGSVQGYKAIAKDLWFAGEIVVEIFFLLLSMLRSRLSNFWDRERGDKWRQHHMNKIWVAFVKSSFDLFASAQSAKVSALEGFFFLIISVLH